ncbi:hypothetical protein [Nevskia ramosa]|uniref:hypothetical protein n=1 Tax=Nevskia ramosa TaxID=64002 RepID=UPI003D0EDADF
MESKAQEAVAGTGADPAPSESPMTAPENIAVTLRAFASEEDARKLANIVCEYVRILSRSINLKNLDGITIAHDYHQALLELDRGKIYKTPLTASDGDVIGVAMTPSVWRDGALKSHIVINALFVQCLLEPMNDETRRAIYLIAHECAHVEVTSVFNQAFPGLIGSKTADLAWSLRWDGVMGCWDEYAASLISAPYGLDPTDDYEACFLDALESSRLKANGLICAYRTHADVGRILEEVFDVYGALFKLAGYHLGNLKGRNIGWRDRPQSAAALEGHWFSPFFQRLSAALDAVIDSYGRWTDKTAFEAIGDILEDVVADNGLFLKRQANAGLYVEIPFRTETMP